MIAKPLQPAQMMMDFLSGEHGKIGQKVANSQFSRELKAQSSRVAQDQRSSAPPPDQTTHKQTPAVDQRPEEGTDKCSEGAKVKASQHPSRQKKSARIKQNGIREDLVFTDMAILEKILAQLQVPAEVRQNIKSAADSEGRISFKTLQTILNQQNPAPQEKLLPAQDLVTPQDVQQLLNSIRQIQPNAAQQLPPFEAKPGGTYTMEEFKNTLEGVVQKTSDLTPSLAEKATLGGDESRQGNASNPSDHPSSERMAKISSMDSSLVSNVAQEAGMGSPSLNPDKPLQEHLGSPNSSTDSTLDILKNASFQASGDPSSQFSKNSKDLREGGVSILQSEAKGPPVEGSLLKADSFQGMVTNLQGTLSAVQQGSQSSSPPALSLEGSRWPMELSQRFQELQQKKQNQITLELEPKNLGKLVLHIGTQHNQVTAWISAENDHVKSLLMQNSPLLKQHLEEQGLNLGQFFVDVRQNNSSQSSPQENFSERNQDSSPAPIARTETAEARAGSSRLVYRQTSEEQLINFFA